jgi:T5orf172 domain-containing protein
MSIYAARLGRYIKIGYSRNPEKRILAIRKTTRRPNHLAGGRPDLVKVAPGDIFLEYWIHTALRAHSVAGEWYLDTPALREFLATLDQSPAALRAAAKTLGVHWSTARCVADTAFPWQAPRARRERRLARAAS